MAVSLGHNFVGTEHLLLGICSEPKGIGGQILSDADLALDGVRDRVLERIGRGTAPPATEPVYTPRAKKALEATLAQALQLGHNYVGTEHLLLGLLAYGEGVGPDIREDRGDAAWLVGSLAIRRAGLLGRAPSIQDVEFAAALLGYGGSASPDYARWRATQSRGLSDHEDRWHSIAESAAWALGRPELPGVAELRDWWTTMASVDVRHDGAEDDDGQANGMERLAVGEDPLVDVLALLRGQGFEADFTVVDGVQRPALRCGRCRHLGDPAEFTIANIRRFEGPTSPEDEALLVALYCPSCQVGGVLVSAYGAAAAAEEAEVLARLRTDDRRPTSGLGLTGHCSVREP